MFNNNKNKSLELDEAIQRVHDRMKYEEIDSEEYATLLQRLDKLHSIKEANTKRISPDTLLIVGGNLLGIVLILGYERVNVVASKALSFVMKSKV
jgi:hypothetical protein